MKSVFEQEASGHAHRGLVVDEKFDRMNISKMRIVDVV